MIKLPKIGWGLFIWLFLSVGLTDRPKLDYLTDWILFTYFIYLKKIVRIIGLIVLLVSLWEEFYHSLFGYFYSHFCVSPMSNVYIATTKCLTAKLYDAEYIADKFYPSQFFSKKINKLARRLAQSFGIKQRALCIDLDKIPQNVLRTITEHPLFWCTHLVQQVSQSILLSEIGYLGIAYNISAHTDNLPNLACQIAIQAGLKLEVMPEEFANYGCAGGLFPLKSALKYCQKNEKAALVLVFDQCNYRSYHTQQLDSEIDLSMNLKTNLLFSDGAAAILLIPEQMKNYFEGSLAKVEEILINFSLSNQIRFENNRFVIEDTVKKQVPELVAKSVVKPLLIKTGISVSKIEEWCIHQGGSEVLKRFSEESVLGLTPLQLFQSQQLFKQYGNFSAPSSFFVLDSFRQKATRNQARTWGMIVGFGAGFYQAALLYQWI